MDNLLIKTDSYKLHHGPMVADKVTVTHTFGEARSGPGLQNVPFIGLRRKLMDDFSQPVTMEHIKDLEELSEVFCGAPLPAVGVSDMRRIVTEFGGKWPVVIKALQEGTVAPRGVPLFTMRNISGMPWVTQYVESILQHVWYPCTVAATSLHVRQRLNHFHDLTSDAPKAIIDWQLHDFGYRATTCDRQGAIGSMAHLAVFNGSDTLAAMPLIRNTYGLPYAEIMAGSIFASEHSVQTSRGEEGEFSVVEHIIDTFPTGGLSIVNDSYNCERHVTDYLRRLKDKILARTPNKYGLCKFVTRPDSLRHAADTPEDQMLWTYQELAKIFGYTVNDKGYEVLNPKVGLIWGDGIDRDGVEKILQKFADNKISTECLVFGMGGGLLQKLNRDTQRWALKASAVELESGVLRKLIKNPLDVSKKSKAGVLGTSVSTRLVDGTSINEWCAAEESVLGASNMLVEAYNPRDGIVPTWDSSWHKIRQRVRQFADAREINVKAPGSL